MDSTRATTLARTTLARTTLARTTLARTARRHWWALCAGLLIGIGTGGVGLAQSEPVYASSTSVLVAPVGGGEVNLQTEAQLARSTETAVDAAAALDGSVLDGSVLGGSVLGGSDETGSPSLRRIATVEVLPDTSVLVLRYEAATPEEAKVGARAFADAYLANRAAAATAAIDEQSAALTRKIGESNTEVALVNARIANLPSASPELANLRAAMATLTTQITALTTRVNDLATTTVNPGRIIDEADLPTVPVRPHGWLYLGWAAGAGMLVAMVAALARDRLSRHVRHGMDVIARSGVTVLAELPGDSGGNGPARWVLSPHIAAPQSPGGRAFNRLRNEVVASLGADDQTILVTGASPGPASTVVAANLAAALARADHEVVLVGANVPEIAALAVTLSQLFDVGDIPGLTDVLTGRASLARAVQRAARSPRLRVVTPGGTASAAGLLQSEGVRSALHALAGQASYLVVEAPSTASGADAQSLAGVCDAAILVVEAGRTRHAQVADAAVQLRLVGTRLLGAIVVPRVVPQPIDAEPMRAMHRAEDARALADDVWLNDARAAVDAPTTVLAQLKSADAASAHRSGLRSP